ncbi:MAG: hypothetical protein AAGL89_10870 [Pseudomonadota bacterium]
MKRVRLPALLWPLVLCTGPTSAQDLGVCQNLPFSQSNCVQVLACIGEDGLWFDGKARGWDQGTVTGMRSDDVLCKGTWNSNGPMGTGIGEMTCQDGTDVNVIYYNQDNITGTVIGRGFDSDGRQIQIWSGENVLQFLTAPGAFGPALPCVFGDIPVG